MDNSTHKKSKKYSARIIILFVVGGLLSLSIPLTYVLWGVLAFFMAICFSLLCAILPFMIPLVIPEGGDTQDLFGSILQGMLNDHPSSVNIVSVILTIVGISTLVIAIISLSKNKQSQKEEI